VDQIDMLSFMEQWLLTGSGWSCDLNKDEIVNLEDFAETAQDWLWQADWYGD